MEVSGRRTRNEDQSTPEIKCQPCQEDSVVKQAYGYCLNCDEYLCETCYKYHRRQKLFKEHVLVDEDIEKLRSEFKEVEDLPPPVPERKKDLNTKCNIHSNEDLKYHCKTHDAIICSVCAIKQHKGCPNLLYIPEIFDSKNGLHQQKVEYVQRKVEYKLNQERDARKLAEESYKSALLVLETQRKEINMYFEKIEKHFHEKVSNFLEESEKREREMLELGQTLKSKTEQMTGTTEKYLSMQKTEEEIKNINTQVLEVFGHPSIRLTYTPQQQLPQLGEAKVENKLGELDRRKLELQRKLNIAGGKEKCSITDGAIVSNNGLLLVLADWLNDRLAMISEEYDVDFHQCTGGPWGVTCISETEVAVTFLEDEEVRFFNIGGTVTCADRKCIKMSGLPAGIRYYKSACSLIISVCKNQSTNLELWSVDGHLLRTVASVAYKINYMTLTTENHIVVSATDPDHTVSLLNLDGTVLRSFDYIDDNMFGPFGVASDACGNIYVCGKGCLRVVSKQGKWEQILHRDDGFAPQTVLVCDKTNRLFIGQAQGKGFTDLLVYQM